MKSALAALFVMGVVGIGGAAGLGLGTANAETGVDPALDHVCTHAVASSTSPRVTLGARNPQDISVPLVGIRAKTAGPEGYCASDDFKHPADYGSGPE